MGHGHVLPFFLHALPLRPPRLASFWRNAVTTVDAPFLITRAQKLDIHFTRCCFHIKLCLREACGRRGSERRRMDKTCDSIL